jgi:hypothetical protein
LSTTFVSPVTICTPQFFAASRIKQTMRHKVSIGKPSSMINPQSNTTERAAHRQVTHFTVP